MSKGSVRMCALPGRMAALPATLVLALILSAAEPAIGQQIADRTTVTYPLTGVRLEVMKVVNRASGEGYLEAVDARGNAVNLRAAAAAEERARLARYGKLDPHLHSRLESLPPTRRIPVSIWLNLPEPALTRRIGFQPTAAAARQALASHLESMARDMAPARQGVVGMLARMGAQARQPRYAPAVFAELTAAQIEVVSKHPDVGVVYGPEEYGPTGDDASTTHKAFRVWETGNLGLGQASRPVVHDDGAVSDINSFLNTPHPVLFWCSSRTATCFKGKNLENHASEVAGVIASTHPLYRGIAPSSQLILSANFQDFTTPGFDARAVEAFEWARGNNGDPTTVAWGSSCGGFQTFFSRYLDWAQRNLFATFVVAAGNHPSSCATSTDDVKVAAPGLAWTAITVGSHSDANDGFWSNDLMSDFSDWVNPDFAPGMEKPEVVAVGADVVTTNIGGITAAGVNGTTFAAAQVAGQVVLLLSRRPGQNTWPETNKAAVLVSAYHDIEGGLGDRARDGVGSPVMNISDDTYRLGRFRNDSGTAAAGSFPKTYLDVLSLTAGQRARAAVAWNALPSCTDSNADGLTDSCAATVLGADIDLQVRHPDNTTIVCASRTVENAWEMCEFNAPVTGKYDVIVTLFGSNPGWPGTFLGTAWSIRGLPNFCTAAPVVPGAGGTFALDTANGSTFFDSYAGWGFSQSGREEVLKLVLGGTKDIRVTDSNTRLDLHVMKITNCASDPLVRSIKGSGADSVFIDNATAGTYWIVVDGRDGAVGTTNLSVAVTGP